MPLFLKIDRLLERIAANDPSLKKVNLSGIGDDDAKRVAEALRGNTVVTEICLRIGVAGVMALAETLKVNFTITTLNLEPWFGSKSIGDVGVRALAEALKVNSTIRWLNLGDNGFGDEGATALAEMLKVNSSLAALYLDNNNIGDVGLRALEDALRHNSSITVLWLRFVWNRNSISDGLEKKVKRLVEINENSSSPEEARLVKDAEFGPLPLQSPTPPEQWKAKGDAAFQSGNTTEAIDCYTEAISADRSNHVYYSNRSATYLKTGDGVSALEDAEACVRLNPGFAKGYSRKGAALYALERYDDAIGAYEEGLGTFPDDTGLRNGLESAKKRSTPESGSKFYAKLVEEDDRNINLKISELIPLIEDVHDAVLFYTVVNFSYKSGGITVEDRSRYVAAGLRVASTTTACTGSVALFKLLLRKASEDGALADMEREMIDREAEVTHTSHAPFVRDLREHIRFNTARIDGLEANVEALGKSVEKLKAGIRHQWRVQSTVGLVTAVLNAVSFGVAGSAFSASVNTTIGSIVDFGDVTHIQAVITSVGDASVKEAFETGLSLTEDAFADQKLLQAASSGNPVVTIAFAAKVIEGGHIRQDTTSSSPAPLSSDVINDEPSTQKKPAAPLTDRLRALEEQLPPEKMTTSVTGRVSCLEEMMFGSKQEGSLLERVARLENELGV